MQYSDCVLRLPRKIVRQCLFRLQWRCASGLIDCWRNIAFSQPIRRHIGYDKTCLRQSSVLLVQDTGPPPPKYSPRPSQLRLVDLIEFNR